MGVTLPYTITNGTPHDAVPVMNNFAALRDAYNGHVHKGTGTDAPAVDFADIANKPAAYPPSPHTHSGDDITSAVENAVSAANAENATNAGNADNADKVDGCDAGTQAHNVLKLDENGKVPVGNLPGAGVFNFAGGAPYSGTPVSRDHDDTDAGQWLTVGPTGSGASIIWPALDALPVGARAVRLNLFATVTTFSTLGYIYLMLRQAGSGASPGREAVRAEGPPNTLAQQHNTVDVQLDANRRFEMYWVKMGSSVACMFEMYLEGWYA